MASRQPTRAGHLPVGAVEIFWEYFGDGRHETVCLLNGLAMHTKAWYSSLDRLLPDYDVLLFDYPGQGDSTSLDLPITLQELAGIVHRLVDHLALGRIHLVGGSYGAFVGIEFARLFQRHLHTLVLSGILLSHEKLYELHHALSLRFYAGGPAAFELYTHYLYEKLFGEEFVAASGAEGLEPMRQRFYERYAHRVHSLERLMRAQQSFLSGLEAHMPEYRRIQTPTLVMPGTDDRVIQPSVQKKVCDILPHAVWNPIAGAGHVVHLEKPDVYWPALREFMGARVAAV